MDEQRDTPRVKAMREAQIITSTTTTVDCMVRNMTKAGAKVEFSAFTQLPSHFRIKFKNTGETRFAELAWQRGLAAGIKFSEERTGAI